METYHPGFIWKNYRIMLHGITEAQEQQIERISDARRFVYNWALEQCAKSYDETRKIPGFKTLSMKLTELRHLEGNEWLLKIPVTPLRYAIKDLLAAYHNFIIGICGKPRFKKSKDDSIRYAARPDNVTFRNGGIYVHVPGISNGRSDLIYCGPNPIPKGKAKYDNVRIKYDGVNYWLSLSVQLWTPIRFNNGLRSDEVIGIDIGIRTSATLSNGKVYDRPSKHRSYILQHRRNKLQSAVDRDLTRRWNEANRTRTKYEDMPKSKNQLKRERKLSKTRIDIYNYYRSHYHKISRDIANQGYKTIVLEDINVPGMFMDKPGKQIRHEIYEARMATLSEYISYKCMESGTEVIYADRHYKSTQRCSRCGSEYRIGKEKTYHCKHCGLKIDRDLNAARNLRDFAIVHREREEEVFRELKEGLR